MNLIAWIVGVINVIYLWCYLVFRQLVTNIFTNGVMIFSKKEKVIDDDRGS